jgi:hypothetical protein
LLERCQQQNISALLAVVDKEKVVLYAKDTLQLVSTPSAAQKRPLAPPSGEYIVSNSMSLEAACNMLSTCSSSEGNTSAPFPGAQSSASTPTAAAPTLSTASFANVNIVYGMAEKPAHNTKKRIEMQLRAVLSEIMPKISSKTRLEAVVTDISPELLRQLASDLDRASTQEELYTAFETLTKQAGRQKAEVEALHYALQPLFTTANYGSVIMLWTRLSEDFYKLLL